MNSYITQAEADTYYSQLLRERHVKQLAFDMLTQLFRDRTLALIQVAEMSAKNGKVQPISVYPFELQDQQVENVERVLDSVKQEGFDDGYASGIEAADGVYVDGVEACIERLRAETNDESLSAADYSLLVTMIATLEELLDEADADDADEDDEDLLSVLYGDCDDEDNGL